MNWEHTPAPVIVLAFLMASVVVLLGEVFPRTPPLGETIIYRTDRLPLPCEEVSDE